MNFIEKLTEKLSIGKQKIIIFPEGQDSRVVAAAKIIFDRKIAKPIVLGFPEEIADSAKEAGIDKIDFEVINHLDSSYTDGLAEKFFELRKDRGVALKSAKKKMTNRLYFAAMMLRTGNADGMVGGSIASTGDMLRASFHCIGTAEGIKTASSSFLMELKEPSPAGDDILIFSDCGVNPMPDAQQLSDIAVSSVQTHKMLLGGETRLAFLSFSTKGSAEHEVINKVREAKKMTEEKLKAQNAVDVIVDGELQADAAIVPKVASSKCPESPLQGRANVLIFPDLQSGNICYKITQRLAGAGAYGPILQGLAKPVNDLSRGCSAEDIVGVAAITAMQS
ncbi:MAG: phosphate acetyltransferase [Verrucomicrobiota bacterium]|nr:phosphate acetyltransferase [Verrucomicrobiota bacterium]